LLEQVGSKVKVVVLIKQRARGRTIKQAVASEYAWLSLQGWLQILLKAGSRFRGEVRLVVKWLFVPVFWELLDFSGVHIS
jgi:hypothetical protein